MWCGHSLEIRWRSTAYESVKTRKCGQSADKNVKTPDSEEVTEKKENNVSAHSHKRRPFLKCTPHNAVIDRNGSVSRRVFNTSAVSNRPQQPQGRVLILVLPHRSATIVSPDHNVDLLFSPRRSPFAFVCFHQLLAAELLPIAFAKIS